MLNVKRYSLISLLLPLCLLGSVGPGVNFLSHILNGNTRWVTFLLLFSLVTFKNKLLCYLDKKLALILICYMSWCFLTSFWSDIPMLSFVKATLLSIVVSTMIIAGIEWVKVYKWYRAIDCMWILTVITLICGFLGKRSSTLQQSSMLYQGLVGNANMLGLMLVMSIPLLLWKLYTTKKNIKLRVFYFFLVVSSLYFLVLTISRSSILAFVLILMSFVASLKLKNKIMLFVLIMLSLIGFATMDSDKLIEIRDNITTKYIYKSSQTGIFGSRRQNWAASLDGAEAGGWFGLGYGVSYGFSTFNFEHGLASVLYGREKGNSQLAIIEETGIVGLILYSYLILLLSYKLIGLFFRIKNPERKMLVGIVFGAIIGMVAQSFFEGWWDAPASPEAFYFWLLVGIARGLEIEMKAHIRASRGGYDVISAMEA